MKRLLSLLSILLLASSAWGAIAASGACSSTSGSNVTQRLLAVATPGIVAGDRYVVVVIGNTAAATVSNMTGTYTTFPASPQVTGDNGETSPNQRFMEIWVSNPSSGSGGLADTITINFAATAADVAVGQCHYSGVDHLGVNPANKTGASNLLCLASTVCSVGVSVSDAGDYLVAGLMQRGTPTLSQATGTKRSAQFSGSGGAESGVIVDNTGATSLIASAGSTNSSNGWGAAGVILRATADGGGGGAARRRVVVTQ
jgi:hypothetical protein